MHHRVEIGFSHARHLFITVEQGLKSYFSFHAFERWTPFLTEFLSGIYTLTVQPIYFDVFDFVEHWHFGFAAPTPEPLHFATIISFEMDAQGTARVTVDGDALCARWTWHWTLTR